MNHAKQTRYNPHVIIFVILLVISCGHESKNEIATTHPTSANLPFVDHSVSVSKAEQVISRQKYLVLNDLMKSSEIRYTVDTQTPDSDRIIGMIDDIAITSSGKMYILDTRQTTVHQFDPSGNYQGTIGRHGGGPGEFNDFFYEPIPLEGESILLQLHRSFVEEDMEGYDVSYIIDSKSGAGHYISDEIPHIITYKAPYFAIRDLYSDYFPVAIMRVEN